MALQKQGSHPFSLYLNVHLFDVQRDSSTQDMTNPWQWRKGNRNQNTNTKTKRLVPTKKELNTTVCITNG